jgi:hypothetical protein
LRLCGACFLFRKRALSSLSAATSRIEEAVAVDWVHAAESGFFIVGD